MDLTDPAHSLGTFRTHPRTSRSGDQELPWKLIIPGGEDDAHEQQQHNTSTPTPILRPTTTTGLHPESTETWSARITGEVLRSIGKNSILVPPRPSPQQQQRSKSAPAPAPEQEADSISPKSKRLSPVVGSRPGPGPGPGPEQGGGRGGTSWRTATTTPLLTPSPYPHSHPHSPSPGLNPGQGRPFLRRGGSTTDTNTNTDTVGGGGGGGRTPSPLPPPPPLPPPCTKVDLPALPGSSGSLARGKGLQEQQHPEQPSPLTEVAKQTETPSGSAGKHEDDEAEAEIVMFSTAYPGQEWKPAGFMEAPGWGYD
ncbi:hypothetical protein ASPACDRAFT_44123 [Aspergillus aculeatus ATCC 16872]|uniref:Uncharacterized protein n=1 Tax=Aspergillus aculeatus (strain ATCC 16872 / CBS 172.66 / WB 5094) TaxID=690307 RepID=A0A1L9WT66_ASPA1|nr:uncharacterized protein ASPACDRAFT_44123 [Aspergillus aculeatus ATCC 16872]OJJ99459.1 hypothetical protein ASPACDRAFT_44123 [Aspergillus aculeatus ATCC 16872]